MSLEDLREKIDSIDEEILNLINERMKLSLLTRKFKAEIEDPERELEKLKMIRSKTESFITPELYEDLYKMIISKSKKAQEKG